MGFVKSKNTAWKKRVWAKQLKESPRICVYCEKALLTKEEMTFEHLKPLSRGGGNNKENVTIACYKCNQEMGKRFQRYFKPVYRSSLHLQSKTG